MATYFSPVTVVVRYWVILAVTVVEYWQEKEWE